MLKGIIILIIGVLLFLFARYLWKRSNPETLWVTIFEAIRDLFYDMVFTNSRIGAVLLGLIGLVMI